MTITREKTAYNSTFAIGGVSCSADSLVVAESFVLRINISGKKARPSQICKTLYAIFGRLQTNGHTDKKQSI